MLRITQHRIDESTLLVKLDGKLLLPWIEELQSLIGRPGQTMELDLSALTYADTHGTQLLADWIRQGARLTACSGYVAALLHLEPT